VDVEAAREFEVLPMEDLDEVDELSAGEEDMNSSDIGQGGAGGRSVAVEPRIFSHVA